MDILTGLIEVLIAFFILTSAYATLLPSATAITIVGINFAFVVTIAVIVVIFKWLQKTAKAGWK